MTDVSSSLLTIERLSVEFRTRTGTVRALEDVTWSVADGETVGIVGESGSGKSVTAYAVMRLLDPAARITGGSARFRGIDLAHRARNERCGR
ncbi:MAG: ATP-binding cassette domain-containing protein [Pseudomonadota bacterium]